MADLAREDALDADVSAPGKRDIEQIADAQAEPPKRARTSESTAEPAAQPEEDARPSESAGDEPAPQDDEITDVDEEAEAAVEALCPSKWFLPPPTAV